eukprot:scaffold37593_cov56-Attheya_sp.AAC.3
MSDNNTRDEEGPNANSVDPSCLSNDEIDASSLPLTRDAFLNGFRSEIPRQIGNAYKAKRSISERRCSPHLAGGEDKSDTDDEEEESSSTTPFLTFALAEDISFLLHIQTQVLDDFLLTMTEEDEKEEVRTEAIICMLHSLYCQQVLHSSRSKRGSWVDVESCCANANDWLTLGEVVEDWVTMLHSQYLHLHFLKREREVSDLLGRYTTDAVHAAQMVHHFFVASMDEYDWFGLDWQDDGSGCGGNGGSREMQSLLDAMDDFVQTVVWGYVYHELLQKKALEALVRGTVQWVAKCLLHRAVLNRSPMREKILGSKKIYQSQTKAMHLAHQWASKRQTKAIHLAHQWASKAMAGSSKHLAIVDADVDADIDDDVTNNSTHSTTAIATESNGPVFPFGEDPVGAAHLLREDVNQLKTFFQTIMGLKHTSSSSDHTSDVNVLEAMSECVQDAAGILPNANNNDSSETIGMTHVSVLYRATGGKTSLTRRILLDLIGLAMPFHRDLRQVLCEEANGRLNTITATKQPDGDPETTSNKLLTPHHPPNLDNENDDDDTVWCTLFLDLYQRQKDPEQRTTLRKRMSQVAGGGKFQMTRWKPSRDRIFLQPHQQQHHHSLAVKQRVKSFLKTCQIVDDGAQVKRKHFASPIAHNNKQR